VLIVPYYIDEMGIMDEITLGGRVEFVTWIRVMDNTIWIRANIFKEETFWMTQRAMVELFDCI
jgi:hypothetical protein